MGRQLPVLLAEPDEQLLLDFLRSAGELRVFESFADTASSLEVARLPPATRGHLFFTIWPTRFTWRPEFGETRTTPPQWYISNTGVAPVLEYSRPPLNRLKCGRLYWSDRFSGEPAYDRDTFGRWIDAVWSWVRRSAQRLPVADEMGWCFPAAIAAHRLDRPRH